MLRLTTLLLLALAPAAAAGLDLPEGVVHQSVRLTANGVTLSGFALRPERPGKHPAVFCAHGFAGTSSDVLSVCASLASLGYVAMSVDFRGCGRSDGHPGFAAGEVQDALAALSWLRSQDYVDARRVGLFGVGMGGMVALLAAASDPQAKAVAAFMTPADAALYVKALETQRSPLAAAIFRAVGGTPAAKADAYRLRSPVGVAGRIAAPVLLAYGGKDDLVPPEHGTRLCEVMVRAGRSCTVRIYPGEGSTFAEPGNAIDSVLTLTRFLNQRLGNTPAAGTRESCALRRMALALALQRRQSAGVTPSRDAMIACDLALAALDAKRWADADQLLSEALAAVSKSAPLPMAGSLK